MLANNHKNQTFWQLTAVFISEILTSMFANLSRLVDSYPMCYCIREVPFCIPYAAKFLRSTILVDFADGSSTAKIAPRKTWRDRLIIRTWIWIWIWIWIICIFIGSTRKGSRTQNSQMYKGWDSKARDSFNHSLFCKEGKQCLHVLVDMIAAHHQLHAKLLGCHLHAFSPRSAPAYVTLELIWHLIHTHLSPNEY